MCRKPHKGRNNDNDNKDKTMKTIIKKTIEFGKVAYWGKHRTNMADVTIELRECGNGVELSIMGGIWNHIHTNYYTCGQCLDTMAEYLGRNPTFKAVYRLWKNYHLKIVDADVISEVYNLCGIERKISA